MALLDNIGTSLERPVTALRRHAICLAVAAAAAIGALLYAAAAAMLVLEGAIGAVPARFTVAGGLLLVAVASYFAPRLLNGTDAGESQAAEPKISREEKIAMVFEALLLGYSMGSRKPEGGSRK